MVSSGVEQHIRLEGLTKPLTKSEAQRLIAQDPVGAAFLLMALSTEMLVLRDQQKAADTSPSAPPASQPVYKKPTTRSGRKGNTRRGAKPGHPGRGRPGPERIDQSVDHPVPKTCPHCGGTVKARQGSGGVRVRVIEDLPEDLHCQATAHHIARGHCTACGRAVEATVPDALPRYTIGHRMMVLMAWLRFGLGISLGQIGQVLNAHLQTRLSEGAIVKVGYRLAELCLPWYEDIARQVKTQGVLHADETGWRVTGRTHWLWCFCTNQATYYQIERSRGSPVLTQFFSGAFDGVLVTDFYAPYNQVESAAQQKCLAHLFRELDHVSQRDDCEAWRTFHRKLQRILSDALRLKREDNMPSDRYETRRVRIEIRLGNLLLEAEGSENPNVRRLFKRLKRHEADVLTFLDYENVPITNNLAERELRPAVILRKNTHGNQSDRGAAAQAVLMTIFRTLKRRGHNPMDTLVAALRHYTLHGHFPALPSQIPAHE